jgi:hypothetical protein
MVQRRRSITIALLLAGLAMTASAQSDAPRNDLPQPYRTTRD